MQAKRGRKDDDYICSVRHLIGQTLLYNVKHWYVEIVTSRNRIVQKRSMIVKYGI